jgi:hypothetical protein
MSRKVFGVGLCAMLFALGFSVQAQETKSAIGALIILGPWSAFCQGLRDHGYVEGKRLGRNRYIKNRIVS